MSNDSPKTPPGAVRPSGPEPRRTIYGPAWREAQRALATSSDADDGERSALRELASRFDVGWVFIRPLLLYAQDHPEKRDEDPVVRFAVETAELFRELAEIAFGWVAAPRSERHDPDSMGTELERLATHVGVLELAVRGLPEDGFVAAVQLLARELPAWCQTVTTTVSVLADLWDMPDPPSDAGPGA